MQCQAYMLYMEQVGYRRYSDIPLSAVLVYLDRDGEFGCRDYDVQPNRDLQDEIASVHHRIEQAWQQPPCPPPSIWDDLDLTGYFCPPDWAAYMAERHGWAELNDAGIYTCDAVPGEVIDLAAAWYGAKLFGPARDEKRLARELQDHLGKYAGIPLPDGKILTGKLSAGKRTIDVSKLEAARITIPEDVARYITATGGGWRKYVKGPGDESLGEN